MVTFSPYVKHLGPGPHPSGSPQSAHAGGRTHAYVETRPDADLPQKFAPFGHDTEYAFERIKAMPIFEGWDAQLIEEEGITDIILTKEIVGQGYRYIRFSHSEWLELEMQGGYPADTLLMQAKVIEMFVNDPKARQLWDRLPVNISFQSHEDMRGTLNAVGLYLDKGQVSPNATIQLAYEFEGDMRSEQDMFETLVHEYGHALDYQYSSRPKVGWAEWTAPPTMSEDYVKVLPVRDPWQQVVHFVGNWWGPTKRPGDHLSQRLLDAWSYPGSKRSPTEFFAEAVQYWVTEPRILSDTALAYNRYYEKSGKDTVFFDGEKEYPVYSGPVDVSVLTDYIELALSAQPVVKRFVTEVPLPPPLDPSPYIEGMSRREWEQRVGKLRKHMGPGNHPGTGTPQTVHGGQTHTVETEVKTGDFVRESNRWEPVVATKPFPYKIIKNYSGSGVHSSSPTALPVIVESGGLDPLASSGGYFGRGIYTSFGPSGQHLQEEVLGGGVKFHVQFDLDKVIYMESDDWGRFDHNVLNSVIRDALLKEHPDPAHVEETLKDVRLGLASSTYPLLLEAGFDGIVWSRGTDWDYGNEWGSQVVLMDRSKFRVTDIENLPEVIRRPPGKDARRMLTEEWKELTEEKVRQALVKSIGDTLVLMWADFAPLLEGDQVIKHYGPGKHPSGSPQTVHGKPGEDGSRYTIERTKGAFAVRDSQSGKLLSVHSTKERASRAVEERSLQSDQESLFMDIDSSEMFPESANNFLDTFVERNGDWTGPDGRRFYVNNRDEVWVESADGVSKSRLFTKQRGDWYMWGVNGLGEVSGSMALRPPAEMISMLGYDPTDFGMEPYFPEIDPDDLPDWLNPRTRDSISRTIERNESRLEALRNDLDTEKEVAGVHSGELDPIQDSDVVEVQAEIRELETETTRLRVLLNNPPLPGFESPTPTNLIGEKKPITSATGHVTATVEDPFPLSERAYETGEAVKNWTPEDIFDATIEMDDGTRYVSQVSDSGYGDSSVYGDIYDEDGNLVGKFHRELNPDTGDVYNASFSINPEYQGQGIGTLFLAHWEEELAAAGFEQMRLQTVDIGQYAWAVSGYDWDSGLEGYMDFMREMLDEDEEYSDEGESDLVDSWGADAVDEMRAMVESFEEGFDYPQPWEIAAIGSAYSRPNYGRSEHLGKRIMLDGPGWYGIKYLDHYNFQKSLSYSLLYNEWARRNPAAIENDAPEWWAAVRQLQGKGQVAKHLPGQHDQSTHGNWARTYRGAHQPSASYGAPAHDLTQIVSDDIYTHPEWYMSPEMTGYRASVAMIRRVRNNPDAMVKVYRAAPKSATKINPGDWVTPSRNYAREHGRSNLTQGEWRFLSAEVPARELIWPGDHLPEWGWFPGGLQVEKGYSPYAKHYGPGPHPGTGTPQTEHASDRQPQLSDKLFGEKPPTPITNLSFSIHEEPGDLAHLTERDKRLERYTSREDGVEWTEEDCMLVRHAVEDFERFLPGALPEDLEFRIGRDEPATMAWVLADQPSIVWVNEESFLDVYKAERFSGVDPPNLVAHEVFWDTLERPEADTEDGVWAVKQAAIFHELVHVAASSRNIGIFGQLGHRWPAQLPYYGPEWFQEQLRVGDPRLPSNYAVDSKAEFLAEALSEYWYQGDDASEISKTTYQVFRQIVEES